MMAKRPRMWTNNSIASIKGNFREMGEIEKDRKDLPQSQTLWNNQCRRTLHGIAMRCDAIQTGDDYGLIKQRTNN